MIDIMPIVSSTLAVLAGSVTLITVLFSLYMRIRRMFSASVNCWFCNSWSKVPYECKESFDCPVCLQYNGFTKEGDYNKVIPEQHNGFMPVPSLPKLKGNTNNNGLCALCNNNQQLKVIQLANFVPMNELNYEQEIEHFQEQLEKAYTLCKKCDKVLKAKLNKQNAWIFGARVKQSISRSLQTMQKTKSTPFLLRGISAVSALLVVSILIFGILPRAGTFTKMILKYIPSQQADLLNNASAIINTVRFVEVNIFPAYLEKSIKVELATLICGIGILFQITSMILQKHTLTIKFNCLLCWVIILLTMWARFNRKYDISLTVVQMVCCTYLLHGTLGPHGKPDITAEKVKPKSMAKFIRNLETTCSDISGNSSTLQSQNSVVGSHCFDQFNSSGLSLNTTKNNGVLKNNHFNVPQTGDYETNTANDCTSNCGDFEPVLNHSKPDTNLNISLENLHLGSLNHCFPKSATSIFSSPSMIMPPRPVLSPAKFVSSNQNPWMTGFWKNNSGLLSQAPSPLTQLSRSSSESSGFGSQHNENLNSGNPFTIPAFKNHSLCGDFDRRSVFSEPLHGVNHVNQRIYNFPSNTSCCEQKTYRNTPNKSIFLPNLSSDNMLSLQPGHRGFLSNPNSFQSQNSTIGFSENIAVPRQTISNNSELFKQHNISKNWSDLMFTQPTRSFRELSLQSNFGI